MRIFSILVIFFVSFGTQILYGQSKKTLEIPSKYKLSTTDYYIKIPDNFVLSQKNDDEFVFQEKGSVIKFVYIENIPTTTFCDSLTPRFFTDQQLREVNHYKEGSASIYKGKFSINDISYLRVFYVISHRGGTVVGIANYPEKIGTEIEKSFIPLFNDCNHE